MTADETAGGDLSATLERARAGDEGAREELFRALYPTVERLVHRGLSQDVRRGRPWLAARFSTGDVVQEVFRRLLADLPSFVGSHERALVGYLAASIRHRLIDAVRFHEASQRDGRRTVVQPEERDPTAHARSPVSDVASIEEIERFQSILQGFPERAAAPARAHRGRRAVPGPRRAARVLVDLGGEAGVLRGPGDARGTDPAARRRGRPLSDAAPEDPFQDPELPGLVAAALESRDAGREVDVVELC
ncbi:MAG: sigma-70 family RNA polymerase sigma factor, partial [Planctomycetota bacterium]